MADVIISLSDATVTSTNMDPALVQALPAGVRDPYDAPLIIANTIN